MRLRNVAEDKLQKLKSSPPKLGKTNYLKTRLGPDGIHYFDRKTGTNVLINEIAVPKKFWTISKGKFLIRKLYKYL